MVLPHPRAKSLLHNAEHRPWPIPQASWIWYQKWLDVVFFHWSFPPAAIQALLPAGLKLDLHEDKAWVSIVPFTMDSVHPRGLFPVPGLSYFSELNVRTYVVRDGKPGVYFLSIEAAHPLAAWLARHLSPLPYQFKIMRRRHQNEKASFEAGQVSQDRSFKVHFQTGKEKSNKTALDLWLTERYCLYADKRQHLFRADVHHEPWPLQEIEVLSFDCSYQFSDEVQFKTGPDLCHYSSGVAILAWPHIRLNETY